jgi:hypothetical protein
LSMCTECLNTDQIQTEHFKCPACWRKTEGKIAYPVFYLSISPPQKKIDH